MTRGILAGIAALFLVASGALAGPFQDYQKEARAVYGAYRLALFATNTGDQAKSVEAITKFAAGWGALAGKWGRTPPPQYAADKDFVGALEAVRTISTKALNEAKTGDLKTSHITLEKVRDILAELRKSNGVASYSDSVNAYHSHMEAMIKTDYSGKRDALIADAGVLSYLARQLRSDAPAELKKDQSFLTALGDVEASVGAVQKAISDGDPKAVQQAIRALKKPYASLFLRWG